MGESVWRQARTRTAWQAWWMVLVCLLVLAYAPLLSHLAGTWRLDPYGGHGMFVPFYSAFLLWADRQAVRSLAVSRDPAGAAVVLAALALLAAGAAIDSIVAEGLSLVMAVAGLILWRFGKIVLGRAAFPVAFLLFMLPLPRSLVDAVSIHLQSFVAGFAAGMIRLAGIPCYQAGILIELPGSTLAVAEACNGLRFLMALVTLTAAFAHVSQSSLARKALLVASAAPLAIMANAVRVTTLGLAAHYVGPAAAAGWTHHLIGKSVWVLTLVPLLALALLLRRGGDREIQRGIEPEVAPRGPAQPIRAGNAASPYGLEG